MATAAGQVARLRGHGFRVLPLAGGTSRLINGLYLYRFTRNGRFLDTVVIRADDFTIATRLPNTFDPACPMGESRAAWSQQGELGAVVDEFLKRYYRHDMEETEPNFTAERELLGQVSQRPKVGAAND